MQGKSEKPAMAVNLIIDGDSAQGAPGGAHSMLGWVP
jgi:hypothetical protein